MGWSWRQRMHRSLVMLYRAGRLSEEDVAEVCRAPYFGEYRWVLHFTPTVSHWNRYDDLRRIALRVVGLSGKLTSTPAIFQLNVYGNDPVLLRNMLDLSEHEFDFNSVRIIAESCWHWRLPPAKPKGLYYGRYAYRIRFRDAKWATNPANMAALNNLTAEWMVGSTPHKPQESFLYCKGVNDAILAKLLFSDDIQEISDRSALAPESHK